MSFETLKLDFETNMSKADIRKAMQAMLTKMSPEDTYNQSFAIRSKIFAHKRYKEAKSISIFLNTPSEVNMLPIIRHSVEMEMKKLFIPMIIADNNNKCNVRKWTVDNLTTPRMQMVRLYSLHDLSKLKRNKYGILEPTDLKLPTWLYEPEQEPEKYKMPSDKKREIARAEYNELDLIIVPGLAFTLYGDRIGHGMGYYDEFLTNWFTKATKPLYSIGVCYQQQLTDALIPLKPHDYQLDQVLVADK